MNAEKNKKMADPIGKKAAGGSRFRQLLLPLAGVFFFFAVFSLIGFSLLERGYREESNQQIAMLTEEIREKYPEVSEGDLIRIFQGKEKFLKENLWQTYGYTDQCFFSVSAENYSRQMGWFLAGLFLLFALAVFGVAFYDSRRRRAKVESLIGYLQGLEMRLYDLKLEENEEDELSRLTNEIYKTAVFLKEAAENSEKDKKYLSTALEDISHQLKTPIASMQIMLDNCLEDPEMPTDVRQEFLRGMEAQLGLISGLVISLLQLARFDAGVIRMQPEEFSVENILKEIQAELSLLARERKVIVSMEETKKQEGKKEIILKADPRWQKEAITNLVKNAIEHSGEGKSVILRAEDTSLFVKIQVEDEGEGISEKDLPHIFERFYQAEGSAEGSIGIGLAFARTIVEKENGMITVDSEKGRGSVFTVRYWK